MFMTEAILRRSSAGGRDNVVLFHPAAKIAFERPSGSASFTCRKKEVDAMKRANDLKTKWEATFKAMAVKFGAASLCLCPTGACATCEGQDRIIKVKNWTVINENSLLGLAVSSEGDSKAGGQLRRMCDRYYKEKRKG